MAKRLQRFWVAFEQVLVEFVAEVEAVDGPCDAPSGNGDAGEEAHEQDERKDDRHRNALLHFLGEPLHEEEAAEDEEALDAKTKDNVENYHANVEEKRPLTYRHRRPPFSSRKKRKKPQESPRTRRRRRPPR